LGPVLDRFVTELVDSGHYQSQSEVLREGLRLLKEREEMKQAHLSEIRKAVQAGIAQAERGEFVDGPSAFARIRGRDKKSKPNRK